MQNIVFVSIKFKLFASITFVVINVILMTVGRPSLPHLDSLYPETEIPETTRDNGINSARDKPQQSFRGFISILSLLISFVAWSLLWAKFTWNKPELRAGLKVLTPGLNKRAGPKV